MRPWPLEESCSYSASTLRSHPSADRQSHFSVIVAFPTPRFRQECSNSISRRNRIALAVSPQVIGLTLCGAARLHAICSSAEQRGASTESFELGNGQHAVTRRIVDDEREIDYSLSTPRPARCARRWTRASASRLRSWRPRLSRPGKSAGR